MASVVPVITRVVSSSYHSFEQYRSFSLRYCSDPEWSGTVRVYVEHHPSPDYGGQDTGVQTIHMWPASGGVPPYICFKREFAPTTYERARQLAEKWVDCTWVYIASGRTISQQFSDAA